MAATRTLPLIYVSDCVCGLLRPLRIIGRLSLLVIRIDIAPALVEHLLRLSGNPVRVDRGAFLIFKALIILHILILVCKIFEHACAEALRVVEATALELLVITILLH